MNTKNSEFFLFRNCIMTTFITVFAFLIQVQQAEAQAYDHKADSSLTVDYTELSAEMGIQPQNLNIDGAATYHFKALTDSISTLSLMASDMEIISVMMDDNKAEYSLEGDSLTVSLPDSVMKEEEYRLRIRYSSAPTFGLLKDSRNTVWTSLLPRSQRHWIPIVDSPQVTFKTSFTISVPTKYQVWATGNKIVQDTVNEQVQQYRFATEKKVPASDIGFALGSFSSDSTTNNDKKINLAVQQSLADSVNSGRLMRQAAQWMDNIAKETGTEYPFGSLNIIVLPDHNWETKSWGASTVYLYKNRGSLEHQLLRGLTGQWTSAQSLPAHWQQADAVTLYQTLIQQSVAAELPDLIITDQPKPSFSTIYEQFGTARWNAWQQQWQAWKDSSDGLFSNVPSEMLQQFLLMISGPDYLNNWKKQPVFELSKIDNKSDSTLAASSTADSIVYSADYQLDVTGGGLQLRFTAEQGSYNRPVTVQVHRVLSDGSAEVTDITFSGESDTATLPVSGQLQSVWITVPADLRLIIDENKPVPYLLYELRNAETTQQRARAARNLGDHTQDPDLQLAVTDALSSNNEPEVRAGLLASLADITGGAAGTEQTFIEALSNNNKAIQKAGLYGLRNYPDKPGVQKRVQSFTTKAQDENVFGTGLMVFADLASDDELKAFLSEIADRDSTGNRSITAIQYLSEKGEATELAGEGLSPFLNAEYPYQIRQRALKVLAEYEQSSESWLARGKGALNESADPRIRYLVAQGMLKNSNTEIQSFFKDYLPTENDARVYQLIENGIE